MGNFSTLSPLRETILGVIGLGRMAQALVIPLIQSGFLTPDQLLTVVGSKRSADATRRDLPAGVNIFSADDDSSKNVWSAPIQLLAVKPQQLESVAACCPLISGFPLLISVVAGVRLKKLHDLFPSHRIIRAVPNTPALVRAGITALTWGEEISLEERYRVNEIFKTVGEVLQLSEDKLDSFLALTSSGPAFVALVVEAMADGAVAAGLPRDLAQRLAQRTLAGSAALMEQCELHPALLKDMVSSPGGTTIAGIRVLEKSGLRSAMLEAVLAAAERSRSLS